MGRGMKAPAAGLLVAAQKTRESWLEIQDAKGAVNLKKRRPGWACLRRAPTALLSYVQADGHRNGIFDNFVSVNFRCSFDPNVVGAARREAHPGLRVSRSKADACASGIRNDKRQTMNQKAAGFSGGLIMR